MFYIIISALLVSIYPINMAKMQPTGIVEQKLNKEITKFFSGTFRRIILEH